MFVTDGKTMEWEKTVNSRTGDVYRKYVREGEVIPGEPYYARLSKFNEDAGPFTTPRHKHDFHQIRFCLQGKQDFGRGFVCRKGGVSYFPAGTPYGPQKFSDAEMFLLQWGPTFVSKARNDEIINHLRSVGTLANGVYEGPNYEGRIVRMDSLRAIWEEINHRPMTVPRPKFSQMVLMHSDQFDWMPTENGISQKLLATFDNDEVRLEMFRWEAEREMSLTDDRTQLMVLVDGAVDVDGSTYEGEQVIIWSDYGHAEEILGHCGAELLRISFPTLKGKA